MIELIKDIYKKSEEEIDMQKGFNIKTSFLKSVLECMVFATCVILLYYQKDITNILYSYDLLHI